MTAGTHMSQEDGTRSATYVLLSGCRRVGGVRKVVGHVACSGNDASVTVIAGNDPASTI
jgi:hypothetical protein